MLGIVKRSGESLISAWSVVAVCAAFYSYDVLLRIAPGVMKQELMAHYHISSAALSGITSVYFLIYAPMQLPVGMLMDRYGPRLLLSLSGIVCAIGIGLFSATSLVSVAMLSRLLVGLGSAFAFVGVLKLASIMLPPNRFAFVSGLTMALGKFGATMGDHLIPNLLLVESWQDVCVQAAILGLGLTLLMLYVIPSDVHKRQSNDEVSSISDVWQGVKTLAKNPQMWAVALIGCLSYTPLTIFAEHFGIEFLQVKYNICRVEASSMISLLFLGWMMGGPLVCTFSDYIKSRKKTVFSGLLLSFIFCVVILYFAVPLAVLPFVMVVFGMVNSVQVIAFPMAQEIGDKRYTATAVAFTNMVCMLSGLMQGIIGWLYDYTHWLLEKRNLLEGIKGVSYRVAYLPLPFFLLCAILISLYIKETYAMEDHGSN